MRNEYEIKPVLRKLDDLNYKILFEFEKYDKGGNDVDKEIIDLFCFENIGTDEFCSLENIEKLPHECLVYMFKHHYDVFGLIHKDLAIDFKINLTPKK